MTSETFTVKCDGESTGRLASFAGPLWLRPPCYDSDRTTCSQLLHFLEEVDGFLFFLFAHLVLFSSSDRLLLERGLRV